jgi:hypothetical protein
VLLCACLWSRAIYSQRLAAKFSKTQHRREKAMRTAQVKIFKASELSKGAQEKARDWYNSLWDSNDSDMITEMFQTRLNDAGLSQLESRWSLSYCQGDGVAFYGDVDLKELAEKDSTVKEIMSQWKESEDAEIQVTVEGKHSSYHHWNSMRVNAEVNTYGSIDDAPYQAVGDKLRTYLTEMLKQLSRQCEKDGYEEIEYRQSMEQFLETAEANDWEFTETGRIFTGKC